ncbi:hypothetical protein KAU33_13265 [Candidatus Dependentiae bacterium]|nr:hypothetical protein [Candidatus Dependentiae bacterium]
MEKIEKIRREHCPSCGSTALENILQFVPGKNITVYVRCLKCKAFTARYILERYLSDKTYESYLANLKHIRLSGKKIKEELEFLSTEVKEEFERITKVLDAKEVKDKKIEDLIIEND